MLSKYLIIHKPKNAPIKIIKRINRLDTFVIPDPSKLLANFGPKPGTSLTCLSFNGSPVKSRNFCDVVDDIIFNLEID